MLNPENVKIEVPRFDIPLILGATVALWLAIAGVIATIF